MKKMIMAVVHRDLTEPILRDLIDTGLTATFSESKGGMLRQSQNKLYIAVEEEELEDVFEIIKKACQSRNKASDMHSFNVDNQDSEAEISTGDAVVFVWDLDRMEKF